jgi:hypothetical protein
MTGSHEAHTEVTSTLRCRHTVEKCFPGVNMVVLQFLAINLRQLPERDNLVMLFIVGGS